MKRFMIGVSGVALATWLGFALFNRGNKPAQGNDRPIVALPQSTSDGGREKSEPKPSREEAKATDQAKTPPAAKGSNERKFELAKEELARRPELKAALDNNLRRLIREGHGDLEKLLRIDRASARRVVDLLYEQALVANDAAAVMRERGISLDNPQYDAILRNFQQELDAEIRATVGEEKYNLLQLAPQVQRSQLDLAKYYGGEFREINVPLSPDQSLQLAIVMAQFPVRDSQNDPIQTAAGPGQYLRLRSEVPMLEEAGKILTPAQLEVMRRRMVERNMEVEFARKMKEEVYPAHGLK